MKNILSSLGFCFLLMGAAEAKDLLVSYSCGNQITNSHVIVFTDGSLEHREWKGFQMHHIDEAPLSSEGLSELTEWTLAVAHGTLTQTPAISSMGSIAGTIDVMIDLVQTPVSGIYRSSLTDAVNLINSAPELKLIQTFFAGYASQLCH